MFELCLFPFENGCSVIDVVIGTNPVLPSLFPCSLSYTKTNQALREQNQQLQQHNQQLQTQLRGCTYARDPQQPTEMTEPMQGIQRQNTDDEESEVMMVVPSGTEHLAPPASASSSSAMSFASPATMTTTSTR